jgi:hypothetical protein
VHESVGPAKTLKFQNKFHAVPGHYSVQSAAVPIKFLLAGRHSVFGRIDGDGHELILLVKSHGSFLSTYRLFPRKSARGA